MGGRGKDVDDTKDWPKTNEVALVQLLVGRVREGKLQSSTFKKEVWAEINIEMRDVTRIDYEDFFKKNKEFKRFKKQGCEDYELLGEKFNTTTATGKLQQLSTEDPLSPNEERRLEEEFLSGFIHIDLRDNGSESGSEKGKKHKIDSIPGERRSSKVNKMSAMEVFLDKWASTLNAKEEAAKAKAERYKISIPDPYSIGMCMELLEKMECVSSRSYNKAVEKFISAEWRQIFVGMSDARRKDWVDSLD
ncbi:hypothetical protein HRI_003333200 [Hibiscus trionum]|uniref:Myb/SANT-like domain-containing protein n=1 Tax=Hibiscus trionum TaxID=183268 RepID=A0A9W7IIB9_HIBTR|nr:hypothetical protein HRI_003333200 [Hibiscus trionum]